jgi:hypothetical protein
VEFKINLSTGLGTDSRSHREIEGLANRYDLQASFFFVICTENLQEKEEERTPYACKPALKHRPTAKVS